MAGSDLDDELRAAAFARVRELRDRYGGRIPKQELDTGIVVRGTRVPIWNYQKGIFKPAALGRDGAALSVQRSADSPYADVHDPVSGRIVYKYRGTDPGQSDNVALRTAMREQRPLLYLVAVDPGVYDAVVPVYVTGDDPDRLQFTLMADQAWADAGHVESAATLIRREYVTRTVMRRLHQQQFRRVVLRAYRDRCAICQLRHLELLDAAHILPDHEAAGEPVIENGLGLCKIHHSAYDTNLLGIDPDARIHVRRDILEETDGPMLRYGLQEIHGSRIHIPRHPGHQPNRERLAARFERFRAA